MADFKKLLKSMGQKGNNTLANMGLDIGGIAGNVRSAFKLDNLKSTFLPLPAQIALAKLEGMFGGKKNAGSKSAAKITQSAQLEDPDDDDDILIDIAELQEQSLEILKKIDENTKPDRLGDREKELEAKARARQLALMNQTAANDSKNGKGGLGGIISDVLGNLVTAWLGGKGIAAAAGILKGAKGLPKGAASAVSKGGGIISSITNAVKGAGSSAVAAGSKGIQAAGGAGKSVLSTIGEYGKAAASKAGGALSGIGKSIAKVGGRLGGPLAVAGTLYEVNEVATDDTKTEDQKKADYTKIGARLAGMWAGAKAGALGGGAIGGAVGAGFGGVGAAPGAAVGGVVGGIVGAIGGYNVGDAVGEAAGNRLFNPKAVHADNVTVTSVLPEQTKDSTKIKSNLILSANELPTKVQAYLTGDGNSKYEDIKNEYYSYLNSQGFKYSDQTAMDAMAAAKKVKLEEKAKITSIDTSFAEVKHRDPTAVIKAVANSGAMDVQGLDSLDVGASRRTALSSLSSELSADNVESSKPQVVTQPVIVQAPSSNSGQSTPQQQGERSRLEIPASRNQDGTIQRLLNITYKPLFG